MYAIELNNISMTFGNFKANDDITINIKKNEIHSIIGENGAGKSTLMSILFGLYKQTHGTIKINGIEAKINSPLDANKLRIGMVHQHFKLVEDFTVLQNIVLNMEDKNIFGFVSNQNARDKINSIMKKYNFHVDLKKKISKCSVAEQQRTEILKMLYRDADILIFDEPTAVLSPIQVKEFLKALKNLKAEGKTIILITHKLDEVKLSSDRGTVIRQGKVIKTFNIKGTSTSKMASLMVGSEVVKTKNDYKNIQYPTRVLEVQNLKVNDASFARHRKINGMSFAVDSGEIVAIAGVSGNGQKELINAITGLQKIKGGKITLRVEKSKTISKRKYKRLSESQKIIYKPFKNKYISKDVVFTKIGNKSIAKRLELGVSHIPEDRQKHGAILDMFLWENSALHDIRTKTFSRFGFIKFASLKKHAHTIITNFDVRSNRGVDSIMRTLSGGNQQKFIVGREITRPSNLIVAAQPTRGLDVGAIQNVHNALLKSKSQGKGILMISYELDEVMALADRIIVVNDGKIMGEVSGKGATKLQIGQLMAGKVW